MTQQKTKLAAVLLTASLMSIHPEPSYAVVAPQRPAGQCTICGMAGDRICEPDGTLYWDCTFGWRDIPNCLETQLAKCNRQFNSPVAAAHADLIESLAGLAE